MFLLKKLSSDDDKRMQSIDSVETYAYVMNKDLVCNKEYSFWIRIKKCIAKSNKS